MTHLGRYRLLSRLGSGAFATVWLAHDDELDIDVAVKVLADNWIGNAEIRERFLAEARLLRRISDPRVVRVHDIGVNDVLGGEGQPYFVMDYVPGGTLADLVERPPSARIALALGAETAYAVQVLHDHDVVHRDVKPSNLLLSGTRGASGARAPGGVAGADLRTARVLVADLGMAKSLAEASGLTVTAGTPAYMAPEQIQGGDGFDARADVYAVAAVTYALVTGRPPFPVVTLSDVLRRDPAAAPEPLSARHGLPTDVDALLASALRVDPADRPATAAELGDRLLALAHAAEESAEPSPPPAAPPDPARPAWSARVVALWSVAAFLVAGAVTWGLLAGR